MSLSRFVPLARSVALAPLLVAAACAPQAQQQLVSAPRPDPSTWAFATSDVPLDPGYRFGTLANGMRYVVRHNATPKGTAQVRLDIQAGSLDETDAERGYAHYVEHLAFEGSKELPTGGMIPLLERLGLAFGADTNATTSFDRTLYKLDLPNTSPELVDTALMLMRETAGNLTISQEAVDRQRGVILSEMRDRNTFELRDYIAGNAFFYPDARFGQRMPIGTTQALQAADATSLRAFYHREYVPRKATLVVIGDVDADKVEAEIKRRFGDWQATPAPDQPDAGPVRFADKGRTAIYVDPAVSERVTVIRSGPWLGEPDTLAQRQENLLRQVAYGIVNRRLQRLSRQDDPPFRGAGFGTGDIMQTARSTRLIVDTVDRKWRRGLIAAGREYRRALSGGFTQAEVDEQVANIRTSLVNAAASQSTRSNGVLTAGAIGLVEDRIVPSDPQSVLARFEAFAPQITPEATLAAMRREAVALDDPLIRYTGRSTPAGGTGALRAAWREARAAQGSKDSSTDLPGFAYTDFGPAGTVASDRTEDRLGIREIRFANGVMLNLRKTDLEAGKVRVAVAVDGGDRIETRTNPLATQMVPWLDDGGLGKHSVDQLQSILAGHTVSASLASADTAFVGGAVTTPADLELELELFAALITDPGYRHEGEVLYWQQVNTYFKQLRATPGAALGAQLGGIISDDDPRFTLQPVDGYRGLNFAKLKRDISDRLAKGAIEVGIVGDFDEDEAIALVAQTFGALPPRETAFHDLADKPARTFTADRSKRVVRHDGPADQAILRLVWPTRDDADPVEAMKLSLLERVVRLRLNDGLREALGKAYSPSAISSLSHDWVGYGTFSVFASIDVADIPAARQAFVETMASLRDRPPSEDELERARKPMLESIANALKSNGGWLSLVRQAQSEPERIDRYENAAAVLGALTAADVQAMALKYLDPARALEVEVLPEGVDPPAVTPAPIAASGAAARAAPASPSTSAPASPEPDPAGAASPSRD